MLPSPLHLAACLPRIDHWDHDQECTVCLTDKCILLIGLSFITEKIQSTKRVPLSAIHTMRLGNLVSAHLSLLPPRSYGAVQLIWGPVASTKWSVMWNPMSKDVPAAIFHHHPCHYSIKPLESMELFDCDNMVGRLREILEIYAVQPLHENITLNARFNPFNLFYNQSSLGFCKDRNGVNF
ncbi:Tumor protein p63-regulated protein [Fasciolopsis buskii]|uniref:Tumor protein p63-regulated protein n=1 Tax=Fasciolopsis buskii TaxID=27845 RepID=A0A8E0RVU5_9TREM|nr:Tumor protein p63-regulated protein [Fasciolopsis buski]